MERIRNLKLTRNKVTSLLLAGTLAFTLSGCSNSKQDAEITSSTAAIEEVQDNSEYQETVSTRSEDNFVTRNLEDADSAVEAAIGIMTSGAEELSEASDDAKQTESYQKAKEQTIENFKDLSGFLFYHQEIAGYTIDDVKESTVEKAKSAKENIEEDLEEIAPDYKEKLKEKYNDAKEWITSDETKDKLADGYNKVEDVWNDLKAYGNDIKNRAGSRR